MTTRLIQRRPIVQVEPAEIQMVIVVPVIDTERHPIEGDDVDLELVVGTRGRSVTVAGKVVKAEMAGAVMMRTPPATPVTSQSPAAKGPEVPASPPTTLWRLAIKTDGSWADGPAKR